VASPPNVAAPTETDLLLWTTTDVVRLCQVNKHAAVELIHAAGAIRIGRRSLRVRPADLEALLDRRRARGEA
jgi:hypothetical protein